MASHLYGRFAGLSHVAELHFSINLGAVVLCRYPKLYETLCDTNRNVIARELFELLVDDPSDDEIAAYIRSRTELPP